MDAALKRSRSEEPAEVLPSAGDLEEEEEEGMEQGLEEEEEVDPRIQGELEKLNQSTDDINRRETELEPEAKVGFSFSPFLPGWSNRRLPKDVWLPATALSPVDSRLSWASGLVGRDARQKFRSVLVEATVKLDELVKKIGKAVEDSKPYWEARRVARQAQLEAQKATQDFQRATEVLRAAKETISLAEQRLLEDDKRQFDSAWQEMLNHATQRVMEAEQTKTRSELVHKETAARYNAAMGRMRQLEKKLKRAINKSKPYFELKAKYYVQLEVRVALLVGCSCTQSPTVLCGRLASARGEGGGHIPNGQFWVSESSVSPGRAWGGDGRSPLPSAEPEPTVGGREASGEGRRLRDPVRKRRPAAGSLRPTEPHPTPFSLEQQLKKTVDDLQTKLALAKGEYKTALKNLEMISDEIHERRRSSAMGPRGRGVGAEGSGASVEDLSGSKPEPDAVSVASEAFEDDNCSNLVSEDDSETQSVSSFSSGPMSPSEIPDPFPAVARPGSLDLPSPVSLSEFGMMFPALGPRSECSGASSPECEVERGDRAEGAENKRSDKANNNRVLNNSSSGDSVKSQKGTSPEGQALENRMKQLSLQCSKGRDVITADIKMVQIG
ncbi:SH3 domain-binding protein 5 [Galemys pyrenaicus]|uniref:SH3 domain-binding protein 5 n=4 Tax=Boreoeutheria TaxID=1437010 RepID=A0A8J6DS26_GALPY|nr:SH3 domain-binding protein 5 [Galemys pyrenaicus]